ncbi:MAG: hypothetical protein QF437_32040, partial [Planctomycetota bacterium]|nr:hypothetical protein [Planctomycetota bacterium]
FGQLVANWPSGFLCLPSLEAGIIGSRIGISIMLDTRRWMLDTRLPSNPTAPCNTYSPLRALPLASLLDDWPEFTFLITDS